MSAKSFEAAAFLCIAMGVISSFSLEVLPFAIEDVSPVDAAICFSVAAVGLFGLSLALRESRI